jgi:hypothetical protein
VLKIQYNFFSQWHIFLRITSPIFTPAFLAFEVYPQAETIVRFLAENTITLKGLGDVCSMALLDLPKHGNPLWQVPGYEVTADDDSSAGADARGVCGKLRRNDLRLFLEFISMIDQIFN